ncbi:MAG: division/cell wall cluster transcriptional repressor MraZ [Bacillota bacterium]
MFMGEYRHNIDEKGRLIVPAKYRAELGESFIITKGLDRCLFVYPEAEWTALTERMKELPFTKSDARAFVRFFFSGAAECSCDSQGRTVIPSNLRSYGKLDREAVIIGVGDRIEIWSGETWEEFESSAEETYEDSAEKLTDLDLF